MERLQEKRTAEAEQEKVVKEKAQNDRLEWATQRDIRLNAKKVWNILMLYHLLSTSLYRSAFNSLRCLSVFL